MKHQYPASSVSRSSIFSDFPSVACFRCRMPVKRMAGSGKVFGLNTLHWRKILPETAMPPDLVAAIRAIRYLCIRASGTSGWKDDLNYTIEGFFYLYADNNIKILNFEIYIV